MTFFSVLGSKSFSFDFGSHSPYCLLFHSEVEKRRKEITNPKRTKQPLSEAHVLPVKERGKWNKNRFPVQNPIFFRFWGQKSFFFLSILVHTRLMACYSTVKLKKGARKEPKSKAKTTFVRSTRLICKITGGKETKIDFRCKTDFFFDF